MDFTAVTTTTEYWLIQKWVKSLRKVPLVYLRRGLMRLSCSWIVLLSQGVRSVQIRSFFLSVFSCIRTEYGDLLQSKYRKIRTRKNSVFGHFSRSACLASDEIFRLKLWLMRLYPAQVSHLFPMHLFSTPWIEKSCIGNKWVKWKKNDIQLQII